MDWVRAVAPETRLDIITWTGNVRLCTTRAHVRGNFPEKVVVLAAFSAIDQTNTSTPKLAIDDTVRALADSGRNPRRKLTAVLQ